MQSLMPLLRQIMTNRERVLHAVQYGKHSVKDITKALRMNNKQVHAVLRRLCAEELVHIKGHITGGRGGRFHLYDLGPPTGYVGKSSYDFTPPPLEACIKRMTADNWRVELP